MAPSFSANTFDLTYASEGASVYGALDIAGYFYDTNTYLYRRGELFTTEEELAGLKSQADQAR
jgi:hypothetical protein